MKVYVLLFSIIEAHTVWAGSPSVLSSKKVIASLSTGVLSVGQAQEFVWNKDSKISQLDWEIENAPIIKADVSLEISASLTLNARAWSTFSSNSSLMDDYDWLDPKNRDVITDWSHHPDTHLKQAHEYDLNFNARLMQGSHYKFGVIAGFQENRFAWLANGGDYQYSSHTGLGEYVAGTAQKNKGQLIDGKPSIGYKQKFSMPYMGISGRYRYEKLEFNGVLKYSPWVKAQDIDQHYRRHLIFITRAEFSDYYGVMLNSGYYI